MDSPDRAAVGESQVAQLYSTLWKDVGKLDLDQVLSQFLSNVGLPREWFQGKRCLDVGCGVGFAPLCIESLGGIALACDLQVQSLRNVQARLQSHNRTARLFSGSALALPFSDQQFDFVHCNGVLHHTRDPKQGFAELLRVTRPGGMVFISVYGKGGIYNALVNAARAVAPLVPFRLMNGILDAGFGKATIPNSFMPAKVSVLDNMYVVIRHTYREADIRRWFADAGFAPEDVVRTATTIYDHRTLVNRLIHGEGYLQFRARTRA